MDAGNLGGDGAERAAVFDRGHRLGVEGFLGRHAAGEEDVDDGLRDGLLVRDLLDVGVGHAAEVLREREPQPADEADIQELAAGRTRNHQA